MIEPSAMRTAVARLLSRDVDAVEGGHRQALDYDTFLAHRAICRVSGQALIGRESIGWTLIEKTTEGPQLAVPYLSDNGAREFEAYNSGLLQDLAARIRAPDVYHAAVEDDGRTVLWLEEIVHDGPRPLDSEAVLAAAWALGGLAGRWYSRNLSETWFFTEWIDRHSQPQAVSTGLATLRRRHPAVVARMGGRLASAERLVLSQPRVRAELASLPATLCHHDAVGANVFMSGNTITLIDWESIGPGPAGADLASLLFSSVRRGDVPASVAVSVLDDAFAAYADGLLKENPSISIKDVRRCLDAAIALRWKLAADLADAIGSDVAPRRGSLADEPPEQAIAELLVLLDVLLDSAERTLDS